MTKESKPLPITAFICRNATENNLGLISIESITNGFAHVPYPGDDLKKTIIELDFNLLIFLHNPGAAHSYSTKIALKVPENGPEITLFEGPSEVLPADTVSKIFTPLKLGLNVFGRYFIKIYLDGELFGSVPFDLRLKTPPSSPVSDRLM